MTTAPDRPFLERTDRFVVVSAKVLLAAGLVVRLAVSTSVGDRILGIGLLVLMATPAVRLLGTLVTDIRARDWVTVAATLGVAAVLAWSLASAMR